MEGLSERLQSRSEVRLGPVICFATAQSIAMNTIKARKTRRGVNRSIIPSSFYLLFSSSVFSRDFTGTTDAPSNPITFRISAEDGTTIFVC